MAKRRARKPQQEGLLSGLTKLVENSPFHFVDDEDEDEFDNDVRAMTIEEWLSDLYEIKGSHSRQLIKRAGKLRCTFLDVEILPEGEVAADCRVPGAVYEVSLFLDVMGFGFGGGCSCRQSHGEAPCEHTYLLAEYLIAELSNTASELRSQITGESIEPQPPAGAYQLAILEELDHFISTCTDQGDRGDIDDEFETARLAWQLETDGPELRLVPLKQRPKKRGGGWTKGQRVSLETLCNSPDLINSVADQNVVSALRMEPSNYYSRPVLVFNMIEAVSALVGHELVFVKDKPTEVRQFSFGVRVIEDGEQLVLAISLPAEPEEVLKLSIYYNGIIVRSASRPIAWVCRCKPAESELAQALADMPSIPRESLDKVRGRLEKIRETTPVAFPESLAGPIVQASTTPVALLRSRRQGHLECGMRVKDENGRMCLPGEGTLLYPATRDDGPVQCRRDAQVEVTKARMIERELNLDRAHPLSPWNWRLLDFEQALRLLEDLETKREEFGLDVVWDPKSTESIRILGSVSTQNVRVEVKKKRDWFGLSGGCRIGEQEFQLAALLNGVRSEPADGYMEIEPGQWARITSELREKLAQLSDVAHKNRQQLEIGAAAAPVVQDLLEAEIDFEAPKSWRDCLARLDRAQQLEPTLPAAFQGTLRDYQLEGYCWLRRLAEWGVGGCLADDMGLGKTVQALAVLIDRRQAGPALVIAPTSVGFNWVRESERFAPDLNAHLYRETDRDEFLENVGAADVVVCSYGLALRDAEKLRKVSWGTLILDEAQFIKNSRTKTSQAIRSFNAGWTLALTGTPIENHLGELWSIFRNVSPGLFGSWDSFRDRFAGPIEKENDDERRAALARVIQPFVLRRTKSEVLTELPERTDSNLYVELSDRERLRYDEMRLAALGEIDEIVGLPETQDQRFRVLALLTRLRQLACHVGLVDEAWEGDSAKLVLLVQTLTELREEGHRALVFSQFTSYLTLIREALDDAGITYQYLDGSTPAKARQQRVDAFQAGESDAFLISLKAGGTGLNLTAADYVIHMDPWWNPAVEDQATDRAHRIGQTRPVMVYRIVARGTIEEQILDLHHDKRDLVAGVMEGTQSAGKLATDELIALIREAG